MMYKYKYKVQHLNINDNHKCKGDIPPLLFVIMVVRTMVKEGAKLREMEQPHVCHTSGHHQRIFVFGKYKTETCVISMEL